MNKIPPAPLSIPKKGEAVPAISSLETTTTRQETEQQLVPSRQLVSRVQATIAVTVRLDAGRYERMKSWGTSRRVTNQEVIVAALDRFFSLGDEEREQEISRVRSRV
jgi:hypothetical protein